MRGAATLATAVCVLALAACGGTPLSVSQLRNNATRVCQAASRQGDRIPTPTSPAGATAFLKSGVPVLRDELTNLRALTPPSSLLSTYTSSVAAVSDQLRLLRQAVQRVDAGVEPLGAVRALQQQLSPSETRADTGWHSLGIPACATS
jgi:hypothetical protein